MIFAKTPIKRRNKFCIFRILSEDLPPRDEIGSREKVLDFILNNEIQFKDTIKGWVVNSFLDSLQRAKIIDKLISHNSYVVTIPWARKLYANAKNRDDKIVAGIAINKARNLAIAHGHLLADFTFVLDGDCFFTENQFYQFTEKLLSDQKNSNRKHYSINCSRSTFEHALKDDGEMLLAEPMPVVRYDSVKLFDEKLPFGKGDKLKYLFDLNHSQEFGKHNYVFDESKCKCFGMVHHVSGSSFEIEKNLHLRISLRDQSLDNLLNKMDNFTPKQRKPNEFWKTIQGYFDFQGLYSHFAYKNTDGAKFVEVGCWKGASTCYLAQEIKNYNKKIELYAVDTWEGSDESQHKLEIEALGGSENLYELFLKNIKMGEVSDIIIPMKMNSQDASQKFLENSLDVVFIDASHKYQDVLNDIKCWYPKVKKGGIIAGHDYLPGNLASECGVIRAVNEYFHGKNLETNIGGRTWAHKKM